MSLETGPPSGLGPLCAFVLFPIKRVYFRIGFAAQVDLVKIKLIAKYLNGDKIASALDFATLVLLIKAILLLRCSVESCYHHTIVPYATDELYLLRRSQLTIGHREWLSNTIILSVMTCCTYYVLVYCMYLSGCGCIYWIE